MSVEGAPDPGDKTGSGSSRIGRREGHFRAVALLCLAIVAATVVFVSWPQIDLAVARAFVDQQHRFWLANHSVLTALNEFIDILGAAFAVLAVGGLAYTAARRGRLAGLSVRAYGFLLAALVIGPGLVANALFKNEWGRARPRQLLEFGGSADFTPALVVADQCASNCSFVAGDASLAFTTLAVALLAPPRSRLRWIALSILFGAVIGLVRVVQGAHFASDVVFAGLFMALTVVMLKGLILEAYWGGGAIERALTPGARRLGRILRKGAETAAGGTAALMPDPLRCRLAKVATRRWWLRALPGLKDFGLKK